MSAESGAAGDPQMASPDRTSQMTSALSSCPPKVHRYESSHEKLTSWTLPRCWFRRWIKSPPFVGSTLSQLALAASKSHTNTSALTPEWFTCPDASLVPSCDTARHDTLFECPSRNATPFVSMFRTMTIDPSG